MADINAVHRSLGELHAKVDMLVTTSASVDKRVRDLEQHKQHSTGFIAGVSAVVSLVVGFISAKIGLPKLN